MRSFAFILLVILIGCKEKSEIILLNPVGNYEGKIDSIEFNWSSTEIGNQRLIISSDADFQDILFDTILNSNSFIATDFKPNKEYSWKVLINNLASETKFTTFNPLADLLEEYIVETNERHWSGSPFYDTTYTYTDTLLLIKRPEGISIRQGKGSIAQLLIYYNYSKNTYSYGYFPGFSNGNEMHINIVNREISITSYSGGLGSGIIYTSEFNY